VDPLIGESIKMTSKSLQTFEYIIQDAMDLLNHFDSLNAKTPPPEEWL
jgi:hypothetical protein